MSTFLPDIWRRHIRTGCPHVMFPLLIPLQVQLTMKAILDTLDERHAAWKEARALARKDSDIDLSRTISLVKGDQPGGRGRSPVNVAKLEKTDAPDRRA